MIEIKLTRGYVATVDDLDADLAEFKWHTVGDGDDVYVRRFLPRSKPRKIVLLHRLILERILGRELTPNELPDHKDLNPMNNTRENIRLASWSQNNSNKGVLKNSKSGYKGVVKNPKCERWFATIRVNKKAIYLGSFLTPEQAYEAYKEAAVKHHGEFARFE